MKTYKEIKNFCETNKVRYVINTIYGKPYLNLFVEDGKAVWREERTILGFEIGMCNISGKKGASAYQWVWYETLLCPETLEDDTQLVFRERYSQLNGSHKGWREANNAENIINRRMIK